MTAGVEGVRIEHEGICRTVVEAVATFQLKEHADEPVLTGEAFCAGDGVVLEALLSPSDKDIT